MRRNLLLQVALMIIIVMGFYSCATTLEGTITDSVSGDKLKDVKVSVPGKSDLTNENGYYLIDDLDPESTTIKIEKDGYITKENIAITLDKGENFHDDLLVKLNPKITVTSPANSSVWQTETQKVITWTYSDFESNVKIELFKNGSLNKEIDGNTECDGSYTWTIPLSIADGIEYKIKITSLTNSAVYDDSDFFSIVSAPQPTYYDVEHTNITVNSATLQAIVNANDVPCSVFFEYGKTTDYGTTTPTTPSEITGDDDTEVSLDLSDLDDNTIYHYRIVIETEDKTIEGGDMQFTTGAYIAPTITELNVTNRDYTSATLNGKVNANGFDTDVTFKYGLTADCDQTEVYEYNPVTGTTATDVYVDIDGLDAGQTYHYKIVAQNASGIPVSSEVETFQTLDYNLPTITTNEVIEYTQTTATFSGSITGDGGATITERGFCYSTSENPETTGTCVISDDETDAFTYVIESLDANTLYYLKAYAKNAEPDKNSKAKVGEIEVFGTKTNIRNTKETGINYGNQVSFTTSDYSVPSVTTSQVTVFAQTTATAGGNVTDDGDATITERGICYSTTNTTPNIDDDETITATGTTGAFTCNLTNLTPSTQYYVRAYAKNSDAGKLDVFGAKTNIYNIKGTGIGYGLTESFTTTTYTPPTVTILDASDLSQTTATLNGTVNANGYTTSVTFQWGETTAYGNTINYPTDITGTTAQSVSTELTGLTTGTTYHYKINATNIGGTTPSTDKSFTTGTFTPPTVTIANASELTQTSAILNGTVNANGNTTSVTFQWGTTTAYGNTETYFPDITGTTAQSVSFPLSGLTPETTYHYKIIATNIGGTTPSGDMEFTTLPEGETLTDYDGNVYEIVTIGEQIWMAENFKGTHDKDGGALTSYLYDNNSSNEDVYGRLYTWEEAKKGAPTGWHLPTDEEWKELEMFLGMTQEQADATNWRGTTEGNKLKETGNLHWNSPSAGTDNYGFTALPGGELYSSGTYDGLGYHAWFWTSTEKDVTSAYYRYINYTNSTISRDAPQKTSSMSVRYIKDDPTKIVKDIDGNIYDVIKIGTQYWMKQNLKTTHYANGTAIPLVTGNSSWAALGDNNTDKAYCYYDNSADNAITYGALYTWAAASNGVSSTANPSGVQGACPNGWHLPSDDEWKQLEMFLGMSQSNADATGDRGTDQGSQLAGNFSLWSGHSSSPLVSNQAFGSSGFMGIPGGGRRYSDGGFFGLGNDVYWWTATENNSSQAWRRALGYGSAGVYRFAHEKSYGHYVRCIED